MSLKLNGATSGSIELDVPAAIGSDLSLTLPATAGTALVAPGSTSITVPSADGTLDRLERAGNILQVVQNYITTTNSVVCGASATTNIPNFSQSITPTSSSSKILIRVRWNGEWDLASNYEGVFRLLRGTTLIGNAPSSGSRRAGISVVSQGYFDADAISTQDSTWFEYLDSPNTTSTITYQLAVNMEQLGTLYLNRTANDTNVATRERLTSSMTLIEVAG